MLQHGAVKIDEDSKKHILQVAFGILAIQALALDKQGHEVSSFVEQWFGEVRAWPAEILQIRVCHYLHIDDCETAQNITEEWIEDKQNQGQHGYEHVVELYIKNVLLPNNLTDKAQDFLNNCVNITEERKQNLLLCMEECQEMLTCNKVNDSGKLPSSNCQSDIQEKHSKGSSFSVLLRTIRLCATTKQLLNIKTLKTTLKTGARLVILLYFLYTIIARTNMPGDIFNKGTGPNALWMAVKQAWRALFAPYHMMSQ